MLIVGLTGGIGSGKSTVADLFAERGVPIIDADVIAREITQTGEPAYQKIIDHFGKNALSTDGTLNRSNLRKIIFEQADERLWLENLLHPIIRATIEQRLRVIAAPYCITVIPLLLEVEPYPFINRILVVDAPEQMQIERVAMRDKSDPSQIKAMLQTQATRSLRLASANDVIINDGVLADLTPQIDKLHQIYLKLSQADR